MRLDPLRDVRSPRYWRGLLTSLFAAVGVVAVLISISAAFWPNETSLRRLPLLVATLVSAFAYAIWRTWPRDVARDFERPGFAVRIVVGDLLERRRGIIVGMTTTFDTSVPEIISPRSVQGQLLSRVFDSDTASLDKALRAQLVGVEPIGVIRKPGKQETYPLGTVVVIDRGGRRFYCVAYSEMNASNEARATIDGLWQSLSNLWDEVRKVSNGEGVAIAVVGGGQSRVSQVLPPDDSVKFIAMSFVLASRHTVVCESLDIVVTPDVGESIDMPGVQAFLDALSGAKVRGGS